MQINQACALLFHPNIYFLNRLSCSGLQESGVFPRMHCVRGGEYFGQVSSLSQGGFLLSDDIKYNKEMRLSYLRKQIFQNRVLCLTYYYLVLMVVYTVSKDMFAQYV